MNYDIPRTQIKPSIVIEKGVNTVSKENHARNDYTGSIESPDLGGYISFGTSVNGGTASGVSLSTVSSYTISFMPREGVIPSYEMQLQHLGKVLEQVVSPTGKKPII